MTIFQKNKRKIKKEREDVVMLEEERGTVRKNGSGQKGIKRNQSINQQAIFRFNLK